MLGQRLKGWVLVSGTEDAARAGLGGWQGAGGSYFLPSVQLSREKRHRLSAESVKSSPGLWSCSSQSAFAGLWLYFSAAGVSQANTLP